MTWPYLRRIHRTRFGHDGPYLDRYYLLSLPWLGVFIHRFWDSDDEGLHDHPWSSFIVVLRGGYLEDRLGAPAVWRGAGSVRFMPAEAFHRIRVPERSRGKVWTLFVHFKRRKRWGFLKPEAWEMFG